MRAQLLAPCDRCLTDVPFTVDAPFDLYYAPNDAGAGGTEAELQERDLGIAFYEGDEIDLDELVREQLALSLPTRVLCREDCRGLCDQCGADLNRETCDCQKPGRAPLSPQLLDLFKRKAQESQTCGAQSGADCAAACGCAVVQLPGTSRDATSELYACQNDVTLPPGLDGFCLIDTDHLEGTTPAPLGNAAIVADCSASSHRRLRFLGQSLPASGASTFIACESSHL